MEQLKALGFLLAAYWMGTGQKREDTPEWKTTVENTCGESQRAFSGTAPW